MAGPRHVWIPLKLFSLSHGNTLWAMAATIHFANSSKGWAAWARLFCVYCKIKPNIRHFDMIVRLQYLLVRFDTFTDSRALFVVQRASRRHGSPDGYWWKPRRKTSYCFVSPGNALRGSNHAIPVFPVRYYIYDFELLAVTYEPHSEPSSPTLTGLPTAESIEMVQ